MPPRSYIEAMDHRPTVVLYTIYYAECATDDPLPENTSQNEAILALILCMLK